MRSGAGVSALGGLGAVVGFFLPWFIFLVAVQTGCHAQFIQVQFYNIYGATVAVGNIGAVLIVPALMTLVFGVMIIILAALSLHRPGLIRIRMLLALSLIGLVMLGVVGVAVVRDPVKPTGAFLYAMFMGFAPGIWVTAGGFALALIGGATLHAAARARPQRPPIGEIALAALGVVVLLSSTAAAITLRPAPYPTLTCAQRENAPLTGGSQAYFTAPDNIYALDAASGRVNWRCQNPLGGVVTGGAPALVAGVLYVASRDGYVYAIRGDTGAILWHTDVGGRWVGTTVQPHIAPIVADGLVFGVNGAGRVYALRASDGARAWSGAIAPPLAGAAPTLLLADGALIYPALFPSYEMTALDERTGRTLWQSPDHYIFAAFTRSYVPMMVAQGVLYDEEVSAQTKDLYLVARGIADGTTRWRYLLLAAGKLAVVSDFTIANGFVYLEQRQPAAASATGQPTPRLVALRARDGATLWSAPAPDGFSIQQNQPYPVGAPPVTLLADGGQVCVAVTWFADSGSASTFGLADTVTCFDTRKGVALWRKDLTPTPVNRYLVFYSHANLLLAGDTVYLIDPSGTLVALDALTGSVRWKIFPDAQLSNWPVVPGDIAMSAPGAPPPQLYAATTTLYALDPGDGSVRWRFSPDAPSTPYYQKTEQITPTVSPPTLSG